MTLDAGAVVDRYRIDHHSEQAPGRDTYAATDLAHGCPVTLTVVHHIAADPTVAAAWDERANAAHRLPAHPAIAAVHDWGHLGDDWYLVAEPASGDRLDTLTARRTLPVADTIAVLRQLADGLDHIHRHDLAHGAVTPHNIVVTRNAGTPTARLTGLATTTPTGGGSLPATSASDDITGLATTAFTALTGHPAPSPGDTTSAAALNPLLPPDVDPVLTDARADDPTMRPTNCTGFVDRLVACLPPELHRLHHSPVAVTAEHHPPVRRWRRWLAAAAAVTAVGVTATVVYANGQHTGHDTDSAATTTTAAVATSTTSTSSTTSSTSTSTSTTVPATSTSSTMAVGAFGWPVGDAVTAADSPEAAYAIGVQQRGDPTAFAAAGSPAMLYAEWLRMAQPTPPGSPVAATAVGFAVVADRPVTLQDFDTDNGLVTSFSECVNGGCTPIAETVQVPDQMCRPAPGCPHIRSQRGQLTAYLRATLTPRWPAQVLVFQIVADDTATRRVVSVQLPDDVAHYDADTGYLVILFADRPPPGTRHQLTVNLDDGSLDQLAIFYG